MKVKKEKSRKGEKRKSQKFGGKNMLSVFAQSKVEAKSSRDTNIQIIDDQGQDLSEVSDAAQTEANETKKKMEAEQLEKTMALNTMHKTVFQKEFDKTQQIFSKQKRAQSIRGTGFSAIEPAQMTNYFYRAKQL